MIIGIKHDTVNGEIGVSNQFSGPERTTIDQFRNALVRDPTVIPARQGVDLPFLSILAGYFVSPDRKVVGLTWVYITTEVLRRTICFTTLRLPLEVGDPFCVATAIVTGALRREIQKALALKIYELEVPVSLM